jgi:Ca-activated chloride channel homolog
MQPTIWNDERITAYVLGELSADDATRLESEMQINADLALAVEEARRITSDLSSLFASEPPLTLDRVKRQQILDSPMDTVPNATPAGASTVSMPATSSSPSVLSMMALAATVLLVGTLGVMSYQASSPDRMVTAMNATEREASDTSVELSEQREDSLEPMTIDAKVDQPENVLAEAPVDNDRWSIAPGQEAPPAAKAKLSKSLSAMEPSEASGGRGLSGDLPAAAPDVATSSAMVTDPAPVGSAAAAKPEPAPPTMLAPLATSAPEALQLKQQMNSLGSELKDEGAARGRTSRYAKNDVDALMTTDGSTVVGDQMMREKIVKQERAQSDFALEAESLAFRGGVGASPMPRADEFSSAGEKKLSEPANEPIERLKRDEQVALLDAAGQGAGLGGDRYDPIIENDFRRVSEEPLSTFSIDVDTASYSKVRQFVMQSGSLPPAGAVRIEELVNYFDYQYEPPADESEHPFVSRVEMAACPWKPEHRLARIAIKGKEMKNDSRPASNLVFLVDTSGSMEEPNKLPLVKQGLQKLVDQLGEKDRVAIVVYAGSAGLVLDSTVATDRSTILRRINQMQSGGSTNGGEGIRLAYQVARDHFIDGGVNRVILCSDGDFNVGTTSDDELVTLVETEAKGGIDITVLGFGMGNHNDAMMEKISGRGNGNYAFIDTEAEAKRVLVDQTSSTLVTIARDVKIQVEFNPTHVSAYRLIGYENRRLANEDFKDDAKDAGEIGAGHEVTAFYEWMPANVDTATLAPELDELRYQRRVTPTEASKSDEVLTVKLRYKKPGSDVSTPVSFPTKDEKLAFDKASGDFRFATSVAGFGMLLRRSEYVGNWTLSDVERVANESKADDPHGLRSEFIEIVRRASEYRSGEQPN